MKMMNCAPSTTGVKVDRVNLKHCVKEFVKTNSLRAPYESKSGYIIAPATHSSQIYIISRNGRMSRAQVAKIARENSEKLLLMEVMQERMVVVLKG